MLNLIKAYQKNTLKTSLEYNMHLFEKYFYYSTNFLSTVKYLLCTLLYKCAHFGKKCLRVSMAEVLNHIPNL